MNAVRPNLKHIVTAFAILVAVPAALAAQTADETDEAVLLHDLAESTPDTAPKLDRQLQAIWNRSGSAAMDLLLTRGRDALERGDIPQAIEHLTALTDHAPDFAEGWHARASAFFAADLLGPALADLGQALTLNPNNYNALFGLASILEITGQEKDAYDAYQRVLAIFPSHTEAAEAIARLDIRVKGQKL